MIDPIVTPPRTIRLGSSGPDVAAWQALLLSLGFHPGKADGAFGFRTDVATQAFQRAHGLTPDGIVGPATRAAAVPTVPTQDTLRLGEVPKTLTPLTDPQIVDALSAGHVAAFGELPAHARLMVAWAQVALETSHGRSLWCWNFGNVSAFGGWPGGFYVIRVQERVKRDPDVWKWVDMHFRAYADATAGSADLWKLLAGRYGSALARMDAGDPGGAAYALSKAGYYTAHADDYARTMTQLYNAWKG